MVEQMPKNDSNDLEDKVRTLQEQNAKLIQILRSQGCLVDSLIQPESSTKVIQPVNVVPLDSFSSTFLSTSNNVVDPHPIAIRAKATSNEVETTNLLDNDANHKHPRPIRPKPSLQLFNSLTLNETKPLSNNVLTPSALINNTNASTSVEEISSPQLSQPKKFVKSRTRICKTTPTTPIPIAPNLGRPLAPAPLNVQRIVTTTKRSSSHNATKKRPAKTNDRFAESISGLMKHFDQELLASNFLPSATTTNILSQPSTSTSEEFSVPLINEEEMRLVEMNFDETTFLKQFDSEENPYPSLLKSTNETTTSYAGSSLIHNNVFTTLVPLETSRTTSNRRLPEEGVRLTARHIEPSQIATKYPDILDDFDALTDAQVSTNEFPLNFLDETPNDVDLQYFYPLDEKSDTTDEENSSPITDLSSIIQIGQNHPTSPKTSDGSSVVHRIVFEPILSPPPPPPPPNAEQYPTEPIPSPLKIKIRKEKRRKSSSSLNNQIPPTPGEYEETFGQHFPSNEEPMSKTTFITPPPDNENHEQNFHPMKKTKSDASSFSTPDPAYAQTYQPYQHSTSGSGPFFPYPFAAAPPTPSPYYPNYYPNSYNYPNYPPNYTSSHDHPSYKR